MNEQALIPLAVLATPVLLICVWIYLAVAIGELKSIRQALEWRNARDHQEPEPEE